MSLAASDYVLSEVVAPPGLVEGQPDGAVLHLLGAMSGNAAVRAWDPEQDSFAIGPGFGADLSGFQPIVTQQVHDGQFAIFPPFDFRH